MESFEAKRPSFNAVRTSSSSSTYSCVDDDLHQRLTSVGPRARKHISDGHLTRGTSIPSFNGSTVGVLDQDEIRLQMSRSRPLQSTGADMPALEKRSRSDWEASVADADEYGDTEDDEETFDPNTVNPNLKPANHINSAFTSSQHSSFFPSGHRSRSTNQDDFDEAQFLQPQR